MLLGALLLAVAAGWIPLVARFYSGSTAAARAVALVAAAGALLIMLRPPLPVKVRTCTAATYAAVRLTTHALASRADAVCCGVARAGQSVQTCRSGCARGFGTRPMRRSTRWTMLLSTAAAWAGGSTGPPGYWCA